MFGEMTLSKAAIEFGGTLAYPDCQFVSVSTDSRNIEQGQLFVALRGEHFDAHDFLGSVSEKASGLVVEKLDSSLQVPQWVVPDTLSALGQIASLNRNQYHGPLVALTGSAGKTTVKEMLAAIFANHFGASDVMATRGNLNNHIGVPLTLLQLHDQHRMAVVEMGASGHGEIAYLCELARPDVAMITNVLPAHVEGFGSVDGIAEAKGEIYRGLKQSGTAVLNLDEPYQELWRSYINGRNTLTFSLENSTADLYASNAEMGLLGRHQFRLHTPAGSQTVQLGISGYHNINNALAAAAMALAVDVPLDSIIAGIESVSSVASRMDLKKLSNEIYLVDDTYNANPESVKAAIDALMTLPGVRVLVLGDMAELGPNEVQLHAEVGRYASDQGVDALLTVGKLSRHCCEAFGTGGNHYESKQALVNALTDALTEEVSILIKGSRSAAMEDVVRALEANTEKPNHLTAKATAVSASKKSHTDTGE